MKFVFNRAAIKSEARRFINQNNRWGKMILATFVVGLFSGGFTYTVNLAKNAGNIFSDYFNYYPKSYGLSFSANIVAILIIPFTIAVAGYYLNHIRGFNPPWQSLYKEGFDNFGKYLLTGFLTNLFTALWFCLLIVPGFVMMLAYSQAKYIIHDNPNLDSTEAIKISKMITKGYKGDLFTMYLSFIGWYILVCLTMGILGIYVVPYVETTSAMYYENLKRNAIDTGLVAPEAFGIMPRAPFVNNQSNNMGNNSVPNYNAPNYSNPIAGSNYNAPQNSVPNYNNPQNPYDNAGISPEDTFNPGEPDNTDNKD